MNMEIAKLIQKKFNLIPAFSNHYIIKSQLTKRIEINRKERCYVVQPHRNVEIRTDKHKLYIHNRDILNQQWLIIL